MKLKIFFCLIIIIFLADRFLKYLSLEDFSLSSGKEIFIIPKIFKFTFFANHQLAFSLPVNLNFIIILSVVIIFVLSIYLYRALIKQQVTLSLVLLTIILGAISNFYDRVSLGLVVDYLYLAPISYFNLADLMIGGGMIFFIKDFRYL